VPVTSNPVYLLHGFGTSAARTWRDNGWIDLLTDAGREVIAPDLLGHGGQAKSHDPDDYAEVEAAALSALDHLPAGTQVDAIGFSMGARTILAIASQQPERFSRIIVSGVGANLFRDDDRSFLPEAIVADTVPENPAAAYFHQMARTPGNDPNALAAFLRRPKSWPITDDGLARITAPVLVVLGDSDFAGPADPLMERLPHATLVTLARTDHFATPKNFQFLDAALDFLDAAP
jgi:pimeloyl-ACP methyl ester carboxylesterase